MDTEDREIYGLGLESSGTERSIITARGTGDGLVIRLDGRADQDSIRDAFLEFVRNRRKFLAGNEVTFEWVGILPEEDLIEELTAVAKEYDVNVKASTLREVSTKEAKGGTGIDDDSSEESVVDIELGHSKKRAGSTSSKKSPVGNASAAGAKKGAATQDDSAGLFGGIGGYKEFQFEDDEPKRSVKVNEQRFGSSGIVDPNLWDDADARIIFGTVRSGQKMETEHSIVIVGDVNSGAELVAGGDIIVLGTLRGVAHAGAYEESGGGRVIFSLNLQPTQLRIGAVISRGASSDAHRGAEIARVDGNVIVVERYQTKSVISRRRDI